MVQRVLHGGSKERILLRPECTEMVGDVVGDGNERASIRSFRRSDRHRPRDHADSETLRSFRQPPQLPSVGRRVGVLSIESELRCFHECTGRRRRARLSCHSSLRPDLSQSVCENCREIVAVRGAVSPSQQALLLQSTQGPVRLQNRAAMQRAGRLRDGSVSKPFRRSFFAVDVHVFVSGLVSRGKGRDNSPRTGFSGRADSQLELGHGGGAQIACESVRPPGACRAQSGHHTASRISSDIHGRQERQEDVRPVDGRRTVVILSVLHAQQFLETSGESPPDLVHHRSSEVRRYAPVGGRQEFRGVANLMNPSAEIEPLDDRSAPCSLFDCVDVPLAIPGGSVVQRQMLQLAELQCLGHWTLHLPAKHTRRSSQERSDSHWRVKCDA